MVSKFGWKGRQKIVPLDDIWMTMRNSLINKYALFSGIKKNEVRLFKIIDIELRLPLVESVVKLQMVNRPAFKIDIAYNELVSYINELRTVTLFDENPLT